MSSWTKYRDKVRHSVAVAAPIAGAAVGTIFGGPAGTAIGGTLGNVAGGFVDSKKYPAESAPVPAPQGGSVPAAPSMAFSGQMPASGSGLPSWVLPVGIAAGVGFLGLIALIALRK